MRTILLAMLCILAISCSKDTADQCDSLTDCTGDCLFTLENTEATTMFLSCFDKWGMVYVDADGGWVGLIPDEMDKKYETDSVRVKLCGYARENQLPLHFPDPAFNNVYQTRLMHIEAVD